MTASERIREARSANTAETRDDATETTCPNCNGEGVVQPWGIKSGWLACASCKGTGTSK